MGDHFNIPGHSLANIKVSILEQVKINNEQFRKERKSVYIGNLTLSTEKLISKNRRNKEDLEYFTLCDISINY